MSWEYQAPRDWRRIRAAWQPRYITRQLTTQHKMFWRHNDLDIDSLIPIHIPIAFSEFNIFNIRKLNCGTKCDAKMFSVECAKRASVVLCRYISDVRVVWRRWIIARPILWWAPGLRTSPIQVNINKYDCLIFFFCTTLKVSFWCDFYLRALRTVILFYRQSVNFRGFISTAN